MFSTVKSVQYCAGCSLQSVILSVLWSMSCTVEGVQYCGVCPVLWRAVQYCAVFPVLCTVQYVLYCGRYSVMQRETTSTVEEVPKVAVVSFHSTECPHITGCIQACRDKESLSFVLLAYIHLNIFQLRFCLKK